VKKKKSKVTIVTITRDNTRYLISYLKTLVKNTTIPFNLILVDNNSGLSNREINKRLLDSYMQECNQVNDYLYLLRENTHSFANNCNIGNDRVETEYVFFLNDDTEVQMKWLKSTMDFFKKHENAAVVGSKLFFPDERIQHAGIAFRSTPHLHPGHVFWHELHKDDPRINEPRQFQAVTGGAFCINNKLYRKLGGFDEIYEVAAYEDIDFCLHLKERYPDKEIWYNPGSEIIHYESVTQNKLDADVRKRYHDRNHAKWLERWKDKLVVDYNKFDPRIK